MRSAVMFAGVLFACSLAAAGRGPDVQGTSPACSGSRRRRRSRQGSTGTGGRRAAARSEPAVICGMTVVPADPKVDPKMRVAPPANGTKFTITVVPPTVCKP